MIGYRWSRIEYLAMLGVAYAVPVVCWLALDFHPGVLFALTTVPLAAAVSRTVLTETGGDALNPALERTGQLLALYAMLFTAGLIAPEVVA